MVDSTFDLAFAWLLTDEGTTFSNDPADRGGPTRFGVTLRAYEEWLGRAATAHEVEAITAETAKLFYMDQFWGPMRCDAITSPAKAIALFDLSVLVGRRAGVVMAQRAAGAIVDGDLGPQTLKCIELVPETRFISTMVSLATHRFVHIALTDPTQLKWLDAWVMRAMRLLELLPP